ncbi:MAG: universal stress protein [Deltaproteobacteria bacterium]|nr:universal stress protein [Deltaproteobacteria bacterium]
MYKKILICLDNSDYSTAAIDIALNIGRASNASVTGCHVYAARLHGARFGQMEEGLPARYQDERELARQRGLHSSLIERGLRVISGSYMSPLEEKAKAFDIKPVCVHREGKNYEEIIKEADEGGYDLLVMGALGLGRTDASRIGSVAERAARKADCDILLVRDTVFTRPSDGNIVAAIDGSPNSFGALKCALFLSAAFGLKAGAVSAFDPDFHYAAFRSIANVLTDEAARLFKFKEQEMLHSEIIDKGLQRIYQNHLDAAGAFANREGRSLSATLLSGKPFNEIIKYVEKTAPFILALGRTGVHAGEGLDIGSTTENCLREAPCNVLISRREFTPETSARSSSGPVWTEEAEEILLRIPPIARAVVKGIVNDAAKKAGAVEVTASFMRRVRSSLGEF